MYKYCLIADELRIGDTEVFGNLIGDSDHDEIKGCGYVHFDHKNKTAYFYGNSPFYVNTTIDKLKRIKIYGYYSPTLQGYKWFYSSSHELGDLSKYTEVV